MRIANLLTDFLYQNRYLNIPGIGKFSIDRKVVIPEPDDKNFQEFLQYIQFEAKQILQHDEALINFIRKETGKIKPLAEADLESYLSDCKLLLNIGKPFYLDGIGTLIKDKKGIYHFTPGAEIAEKIELERQPRPTENKSEKTRQTKQKASSMKPFVLTVEPQTMRKILIGSGIGIGLILVIWGGVTLFNSSPAPDDTTEKISIVTAPPDSANKNNAVTPVSEDTAVKIPAAKTVIKPEPTAKPEKVGDGYKFVLQKTRSRKIAEGNYLKIKPDRPDLQIETRDSVTYKIFIVKKCTPADTSRIKQELNEWFWGKSEMRIYIEK